jgi:Tol biopolymer transport system component/DNA-directed RNA polymerase specialized sigma24 family protein
VDVSTEPAFLTSRDGEKPPPGEAIALLWTRYHAELTRLAAGLGDSSADTVSNAFGALLRRPRILRDPTAAHAWLVREVLTEARGRRRWSRAGRASEPTEPRGITGALSKLPARQRECVVLRYCAGLPDAEVAQLLSVPAGSVRRLGHEGLRRLAAALDEPHAGQAETATTLSAELGHLQVTDLSWEAIRPELESRRRKQRTGLVSAAVIFVVAAAVAAGVTLAGTEHGHVTGHRTRPRPELAIKGDQVPVTLAAEPGFLVYQAGRNLSVASGLSAGNAAEPARYNDITLAPGRPGLSYAAPSVNQARTELAFVRASAAQLKQTDGEGDIAVSALNGSDLRVLTNTGVDSDPVWSPDGKQIAFLRDNRVWLMSASGTDEHLLGLYLSVNSIAWSPNGEELAVTSIAYPVNRIAIMNIAGVSYTWFTPAAGPGQYQPAWSPDGRQLVYGQSGTNALFISDVDGAGARRLTTCGGPCQLDSEPAWSPDGSEIAFARTVRGTSQIAVVSVKGGRVRFVTAGPGQHDEPGW